jgi:CHASE3 domain sensor protein
MGSGIAVMMRELEATIALRREKGFEAARKEVLTDRGRQAMLDIRAAAAAVRELETNELERTTEQGRLSYRSTTLARALATLVGLGLTFFAYRLSLRATERMVLRRAPTELREAVEAVETAPQFEEGGHRL